MPSAEPAARTAWSGPVKSRRSASPPNFRRPPPARYAISSSASKQVPIASVTSSAPTFPWRARRSDIFVNPEMSTNSSDPSTVCVGCPGAVSAHSTVIRGT